MKLDTEVGVVKYLVLFYYLLATTVFYALAIYATGNGVSYHLFGEGDDGVFYWEQAMNVFYDLSWIRTSIYPWVIGKLMQLIGTESVFAIRLFNFVGMALLIHFALKLVSIQLATTELGEKEKRIRHYAYLYALFSFIAYISLFINITTSIYRDVWIYMLYIAATYLAIRWLFEKNWTYFLLLIPTVWLLGEFRTYALLSFVMATVLWLSLQAVRKVAGPFVILTLALVFFGVIYTFFMDVQVPIVDKTLRSALQYRSDGIGFLAGGSQMGIRLDASNYFGFLVNYVHSYLGNLVGPLPWDVRGLTILLAFFIEALPMTLILLFLWSRRAYVTKVQQFILTQAFVWNGLIAITNDNIGTALRLRAIAYLLILLVFVVAYSRHRAEQAKQPVPPVVTT
ncbi:MULTISPECIES: hypothetical protein [unclassified Exiguobacterium]|uniref:hypothetical protein n=1 Tax=unclassified Exiguobacterium TaxID=2644629 RepID=UPI001BE642C5|nr:MULTISPECIES: hypothetical protein [unclassified Exiguobacterium]